MVVITRRNAFTNVHTNEYRYILQLALCGDNGCSVICYVVVVIV